MSTTKKLIVACLAAFMVAMTVIPSTFSWYPHSGDQEGDRFYYNLGNVPISVNSSGFTVSTVKTDSTGKADGLNTYTSVSFDASSKQAQYYKTTFNNSEGSGDVFVDLELGDFMCNDKVRVGVTSPVINEKKFNITRTPDTHTHTRVYFLPTNVTSGGANYGDFWYNKEYDDSSNNSTYHQASYWDMNIIYNIGGTESSKTPMIKQEIPVAQRGNFKDAGTNNNAQYIYYYDVPNNATSFFFCNHWYKDSDSNKDWNRTPDINVLLPGTLYRLTGKNITDSYKLYDVTNNLTDLVALNSYYREASVSQDGYVDIQLKKENTDNEDNFTPDYYGSSVIYSSSDTSKATVSKDGLVHVGANASGDVTITSTITGVCGDSINATTTIHIVTAIDQISVVKNVKVPEGETVDVLWYVIDKTGNNHTQAQSIYWTV